MLKVFNTLGRKLEEFKPLHEGKVSFYHCGPTVYWTQHIGNMRGMIMGDLIRRTLIYLGFEVRYVSNYTDFGHLTSDADTGEDKMAKGASREGISPKEIADKYIKQYEHDTKALNYLEPTVRARATDYVQEMIEMVQILLDKGFAYATPKAIYYDVQKFKNYTQLSGRDLSADQRGAGHGDVTDENKKHPADFAIWFFRTGAHKDALQYWPSPFSSPEVSNGEGIPGWHIECSAMTLKNLGERLDIHMGGVEHVSIHHPNEIAQSESANDSKFVNYWIHNEHLDVDGGKMAKSDGTGIDLDLVVERGYSPMHLRYFFLQAHYRSKQNFTWDALEGAKTAYEKLKKFISVDIPTRGKPDVEFQKKFTEAISVDFNIPKALGIAWDVTKSDLKPEVIKATLLDFDRVFGLFSDTVEKKDKEIDQKKNLEIEKLIKGREELRKAEKWDQADVVRLKLSKEYAVEIEDSEHGTKWTVI
jgi:cysteinyl-tRNA synthetase